MSFEEWRLIYDKEGETYSDPVRYTAMDMRNAHQAGKAEQKEKDAMRVYSLPTFIGETVQKFRSAAADAIRNQEEAE